MKYFRKFQANKEKFAENMKAFLAKTSQQNRTALLSPCVAQFKLLFSMNLLFCCHKVSLAL